MFVYVIGPSVGLQKIGFSSAPDNRCRKLQSTRSGKLKCWHRVAVPPEMARTAEQYAHALLAEDRVHGEWFDVSIDAAIAAVDQAISAVLAGGKPEDIIPKPKTRLIAAHLSRDVGRQLRQIAAQERTDMKSLLIEAINTLFKSRGKPQIACDPRL